MYRNDRGLLRVCNASRKTNAICQILFTCPQLQSGLPGNRREIARFTKNAGFGSVDAESSVRSVQGAARRGRWHSKQADAGLCGCCQVDVLGETLSLS